VGNPARFDEIITHHLPRLADTLGHTVTHWWMRRHRDMIRPDTDQHLSLVMRLADPSDYGAAAAAAADFAADLAARGHSLADKVGDEVVGPARQALQSDPRHSVRSELIAVRPTAEQPGTTSSES
jgi:hypothetical protein